MWTPRRLVVVISGLLLFGSGFTVYTRFFGSIDGLPPLPETFTQAIIDGSKIPDISINRGPFMARLRQAFGQDCIEQTYNLKFENREKGILFAAYESKILDDGRVLLQQISVAIFAKTSHEISTVHADRAFLTFDRPVRKIEDVGNHKVVVAELISDSDYPTNDPRKGKIYITNNRRTPEPDDDMILITPGPLHYLDEPKPTQPHIWTDSDVELTDRQNRPAATQIESQERQKPTVTGEGMRVFLTREADSKAGKTRKEKKTTSSVGGVERIELDHKVRMNLWTESRNMFGGAAKSPAPKQAPKAPANEKPPAVEKVLITIQTDGPFSYDMTKEIAHFEMAPPRDPTILEYVKVTRKAKGNSEDTLSSDYLDVQFNRHSNQAKSPSSAKTNSPPQVNDGPSENDMEIDTVHAWGKNIALSSDEEALFAYGNDLFYDARIKQTVLKGAPMHAVKDGNLIRAPELTMANLDDKEKQHARARGPGSIGMGEFDPKTQQHGRQAYWKDWLIITKVNEQGKTLDLVTLIGSAQFIDTMNDQSLRAHQLKLWLLSNDDKTGAKQPPQSADKRDLKKTATNKSQTPENKQPLPRRLEAMRDVVTRSPDLIVHKADYLNVWFKDIPPPNIANEKLPDARESPATRVIPFDSEGDSRKQVPKKSGGNPEAKLPSPGSGPQSKSIPPTPATKKDPPIELRRAERIEVWVNRSEGKNELDKVHTEGNVIIHQEPTKENERGVDIEGHMVDMERYPEGNHLIVTGNEQKLGEVHFDSVSIVADAINIDQRDNSASVKGPGSMRLKSATGLDGKEKPKTNEKGKQKEKGKDSYIDIFWNHGMELDGPINSVRYEGAVQAVQDDGKVLCETMQVWLDRPLYLNQADRSRSVAKTLDPKKSKEDDESQSPKVVKVLFDQQPPVIVGQAPKRLLPVSVEDQEKVAGVLVRYQNVLGTQVEMDNPQNKMTAIGPGFVRIFQSGAKDVGADKPKTDGKQKDDEEMKLTWVSFDQRMMAFNNSPKRAVFFNRVALVHMPSDKHDVKINLSKLPARSLYLRCEERLDLVTQTRIVKDKDGKDVEIKWQEMTAKGNVRVQNDDVEGWAGIVTYSEEKSLLVFTGTPNNLAVLNRSEVPGGERKSFKGEKITYNVKTKDFSVNNSIGGGSN